MTHYMTVCMTLRMAPYMALHIALRMATHMAAYTTAGMDTHMDSHTAVHRATHTALHMTTFMPLHLFDVVDEPLGDSWQRLLQSATPDCLRGTAWINWTTAVAMAVAMTLHHDCVCKWWFVPFVHF
jgi:hypothetical protein